MKIVTDTKGKKKIAIHKKEWEAIGRDMQETSKKKKQQKVAKTKVKDAKKEVTEAKVAQATDVTHIVALITVAEMYLDNIAAVADNQSLGGKKSYPEMNEEQQNNALDLAYRLEDEWKKLRVSNYLGQLRSLDYNAFLVKENKNSSFLKNVLLRFLRKLTDAKNSLTWLPNDKAYIYLTDIERARKEISEKIAKTVGFES